MADSFVVEIDLVIFRKRTLCQYILKYTVIFKLDVLCALSIFYNNWRRFHPIVFINNVINRCFMVVSS